MKLAETTRKKSVSLRNRLKNSGFEEKLKGWSSEGVRSISAEAGHLVHSGTSAAILDGSTAFITQTVPAGRGARLQFIAHLRGVADLANSPIVIRLRWVDGTGSYLGTALEVFIPQRQLTMYSWTTLWNVTNMAPTGTAGLNIRLDAPYSSGEAAVVIDDLVVM
jgi:hypothetical protein